MRVSLSSAARPRCPNTGGTACRQRCCTTASSRPRAAAAMSPSSRRNPDRSHNRMCSGSVSRCSTRAQFLCGLSGVRNKRVNSPENGSLMISAHPWDENGGGSWAWSVTGLTDVATITKAATCATVNMFGVVVVVVVAIVPGTLQASQVSTANSSQPPSPGAPHMDARTRSCRAPRQ